MQDVGSLDISIENAFVTSHAYDRFERHGISEAYVDSLLRDSDNWKLWDEGRYTCVTKRDGVFWKLVIEPNRVSAMESSWDIITVYPWEVNMDDALGLDRWSEEDVLNLAFYADGNG